MHQAPSSDQIECRPTTFFPSAALEDHAGAVGMPEREGKLQLPPLVWSFAFGSRPWRSRTLVAFRRSYNSTADQSLSPDGSTSRLTPSLAEYLRDFVEARSHAQLILDDLGEYLGYSPPPLFDRLIEDANSALNVSVGEVRNRHHPFSLPPTSRSYFNVQS